MKTIKFFIAMLLVGSFAACNVETEDVITQNAVEAGVSVQLSQNTAGKVLGSPDNPADLENSSVSFTDTELYMKVNLKYQGENITKYEIYKSINGGTEVLVAQSTTLPLIVEYTTIDDFISGTQMANSSDLRIGDQIKFRTKVYTTSGNEYFIHDGSDNTGTFILTVSCSSDLAYAYEVITSGYYGTINQGIEVLVEKSPGVYKTVTTGGWSAGSIAPDQGFDFQDVCGAITVPDQDLAQGYYSNDVYQTDLQADASVVNSSTGDLHIEYYISFGSGDQAISTNYIRQ